MTINREHSDQDATIIIFNQCRCYAPSKMQLVNFKQICPEFRFESKSDWLSVPSPKLTGPWRSLIPRLSSSITTVKSLFPIDVTASLWRELLPGYLASFVHSGRKLRHTVHIIKIQFWVDCCKSIMQGVLKMCYHLTYA